MKYRLLLLSIVCAASCNNEEQPDATINQVPQNIPTPIQTGVSDTGSVTPPLPTPRESVFPIGTYKTLPEIMKHLFSEGSTKSEVRTVQGEPDMIERIDLYHETWYYGNCEVHFKGQIVRGIAKLNKNIHYASLYGTLLFSPDPTEIKLAEFLNDRIMR